MTRSIIRTLACLPALLLGLVSLPAAAQTDPAEAATQAVAVQDYDVFVDPPTAFAFIKLPGGWKFIGKLDAQQLRQLPPGTLTSLLQREEAPATAATRPQTPAKRG